MNLNKLLIIFLTNLLSAFAYAQDVERINVTSIGRFSSSQTTLPIGYDLCDGGKWQAHNTLISSVEQGAICIVNGMYGCHSFLLTSNGFNCELGALNVSISSNGLPESGSVYISHRDRDFERLDLDDSSSLQNTIVEGLEHWETRKFNVGKCHFSVNKTGNIFTLFSDDLEFETVYSTRTDRRYLNRSFNHGVEVTAETVAGIPFKRDCLENPLE